MHARFRKRISLGFLEEFLQRFLHVFFLCYTRSSLGISSIISTRYFFINEPRLSSLIFTTSSFQNFVRNFSPNISPGVSLAVPPGMSHRMPLDIAPLVEAFPGEFPKEFLCITQRIYPGISPQISIGVFPEILW